MVEVAGVEWPLDEGQLVEDEQPLGERANRERVALGRGVCLQRTSSPRVACSLVGELSWVEQPARWRASCLLIGGRAAMGRVACSLVGELP